MKFPHCVIYFLPLNFRKCPIQPQRDTRVYSYGQMGNGSTGCLHAEYDAWSSAGLSWNYSPNRIISWWSKNTTFTANCSNQGGKRSTFGNKILVLNVLISYLFLGTRTLCRCVESTKSSNLQGSFYTNHRFCRRKNL